MSIEKEFENIANDTINGASFITEQTAKLCQKALFQNIPYKDIKKNLSLIKEKQNMMASVFNLIKEIENLLDKNAPKEKISAFCDTFLKELIDSSQKAVKNAYDFLPKNATILTHSFSSLVFKTLILAHKNGKNIKIICTESRPKNEGAELCEKLTQNGINSTLITDAQAGFFMQKADIFLIGADGINKKFLVHKTGTFSIALSAKYLNKKVISIATKQKFWDDNYQIPKEHPKNPNEISKNRDCQKINLYFDLTPINLIDKIITEKG